MNFKKSEASLNNLETVREDILDTLLVAVTFTMSIPLVASLYRSVDIGWKPIMYLQIIFYFLILITTIFRKKLNFIHKALTIISISFLIGCTALINLGLVGSGSIFMLFSIILATMFLGMRYSGILIMFSLAILIIVTSGINQGWISFDFDIETASRAMSLWISRIFAFVLFTSTLIFSLGRLINYLVISSNTLMERSLELERTNEKVLKEITEKNRAEEALKRSEKQLRSLTIRLQEIEETERKKLSRELHDQVGQSLTALNINLNILRNQLSPESLKQVSTRLEDSMKLVEETTRITRDVMAELRPSVLDDYGLPAALRWYGEQFERRTGISFKILGDTAPSRLPEAIESSIFRIAQEALTNIAKHANASEVILNIDDTNRLFRLVISDNGEGFDYMSVSTSSSQNRWGIINMQERAQGFGGQVHIISEAEKGTKIVVDMKK